MILYYFTYDDHQSIKLISKQFIFNVGLKLIIYRWIFRLIILTYILIKFLNLYRALQENLTASDALQATAANSDQLQVSFNELQTNFDHLRHSNEELERFIIIKILI